MALTTPVRTSLRAALAGLALALTLGGPALAAPTPTPTPTADPSASATPSATPTESASPTPTPTEAPTAPVTPEPTETATPTPRPSPTPGPTERASPSPSQTSGQVAPQDHWPFWADLPSRMVTGCAPAGGVGETQMWVQAQQHEPMDVTYTVAYYEGGFDPEDLVTVASGSARLGAVGEWTELEIPSLPTGAYGVGVNDADDPDDEVGSYSLQVLGCVEASLDCAGITFTNPADSTLVDVYLAPAAESTPDFGDVLYPGDRRTLPLAYDDVRWAARLSSELAGEGDGEAINDEVSFSAGSGQVTRDAGCPPVRLTSGTVGCAQGDGRVRVDLRLSIQPSAFGPAPFRYVILRGGREVQQRDPFSSQPRAVERLPGPGRYTYRSWPGYPEIAVEDFGFDALRCVRSEVTCQAVRFTNPASNPAVSLTFGRPGVAARGSFTVRSGASVTLDWTSPRLSWRAEAAEPGQLSELAGGSTVRVPQGCAEPVADDGSESRDAGEDAALAATGGPAGGPVALTGALLALTGGLVLLLRGARRRG